MDIANALSIMSVANVVRTTHLMLTGGVHTPYSDALRDSMQNLYSQMTGSYLCYQMLDQVDQHVGDIPLAEANAPTYQMTRILTRIDHFSILILPRI